jgi:hypothetical protein
LEESDFTVRDGWTWDGGLVWSGLAYLVAHWICAVQLGRVARDGIVWLWISWLGAGEGRYVLHCVDVAE